MRGVTIHFDRDTINEYLGNHFDLPPGEDAIVPVHCDYGERAATGNWPPDRIEREIFLPGRQYVPSKAGNRNIAAFADMTVRAAVVFKFLVHNVWPKSHVTMATKVVTPLIWHICRGGEVDVARIVSEELRHMTLSGVTRPETRITFPGFVMGLLQAKGVQIPMPSHEQLTSQIDDKYIQGLVRRANNRIAVPP